MIRVGVEVGGTFTDLVAIEDDKIRVTKVPSTPAAPHLGALNALEAGEIELSRVADLIHGSTVATNAILERKGARVVFLVTKGFRDLLILQRHNRRSIYDLAYQKPEPVVARTDIIEIEERLSANGEVVVELDELALREHLRERLEGEEFDSVAICLLNSYTNPTHERRVASMLGQLAPELTVTCSCDVTREFREFERASTTTLAAYVQPVIDRYLGRLETELAERGFDGRFSVMQSNGGRLPVAGMSNNAITSLFSGPAAGVIGAVRQASLSGFRDLITLDMGGTSTDVCLVVGGKPALSSETEVDGLPIRTPVLDIVTVGAGGGSIVWRDDGGMLRVGPESAGADPGPACYDRGGIAPTITDAHLIRGTLRPAAFLGGKMMVDGARSSTAFAGVAEAFGSSVEGLADDAIRVADNNIVRAMQLVSTERGRDPRDYVLVPFGGAGPLHAARVAEELNITTLCVPPSAGVLSAYGLLASDFVRFDTRTSKTRVDAKAPQQVRKMFDSMRAEAISAFSALSIGDTIEFTYVLAMRYVGQAFEVPIEIDAQQLPHVSEEELVSLFSTAHHRLFEFDEERQNRVEIVSYRLGAAVAPAAIPTLRDEVQAAPRGRTRIFDQGHDIDCELAARSSLTEGGCGPILIEDETSTLYIPKGWRFEVDSHHNLIVNKERT